MSKESLLRTRSKKVIAREDYAFNKYETSMADGENVMSEVLNDWQLYGLSPIFYSETRSSYQMAINNLRKNNATLKKLLKDDIYGLATKRLISTWPENSFEKKYLQYLILRCESQIRVPVNNRVH